MLRLFRVYFSATVAALLAYEFILIYLCYLGATCAWLADAEAFLEDDGGWLRIFIVVFFVVLGIYFHDLYSNLAFSRELLHKSVVVAGMAFLSEAMLTYVKLRRLVLPAGPMIAGSALTIAGLLLGSNFRCNLPSLAGERSLKARTSAVLAPTSRMTSKSFKRTVELAYT